METITTSLLTYCVDFGLVVLIWMVQLIVYPSFTYFKAANLLNWHKAYTPRITVIVAPLMFAQVALHTYRLIFNFSLINLGTIIIIGLLWLITFLYFVPLHQKIETNNYTQKDLQNLISRNWMRTILWSLIFIINIVQL